MAAKKTAKKKTAKKPGRKKAKPIDFIRAYLRKKPTAEFGEIRDAAAKKRLKIFPVNYGRAQVLEGIKKAAAYGSKKKAKKAAGTGRGPGRPKGSKNKKTRGAASAGGIQDLVATIQNLQDERDRALQAIEQIRALLAKV